jgi:uncharacterized protein (TIGR03067 family)
MYRHALVLAVVVGGGWVAAGQDPKPADDLAVLQGNWKPLECKLEETPQMTTEQMKQVTAVFDKNERFLYFVDRDKEGKPDVLLLAQTAVILDSKTSPKSITFEGIYEIAGNQLKLCYGPSDRPRPTEFKAPAGSGYFLETWVRQAK